MLTLPLGQSESLFFLNATPTSEIYTLSLHDALPISVITCLLRRRIQGRGEFAGAPQTPEEDRKSTRLNSSHRCISYAVFCLKKKNKPSYRKEMHYKHQ